MIRFTSMITRARAEERVKKAIKGMILAHDWTALERIFARLAWGTFDEKLSIMMEVTTEEADDVSLLHALEFIKCAEAMADAGRRHDGR